ncbi:MAG: HNH endonuclease signature motif containing protein [Bacteroidota bacterium]
MPGSYPDNWKEIATAVKDEAGWCCIRCGVEHDRDTRTGNCLTVHHLIDQKDLVAWWNLTALCQRCHLHIQAKVQMDRIWMFHHTEWFVPYVAGYYASAFGLPQDRLFVNRFADELIYLGQGRLTLDELLAHVEATSATYRQRADDALTEHRMSLP